jgi:lysine-N-methylase
MKLQVLEDERFSCHSCTHCCRNWHVVLMPGEAQQIKNLPWAADDPLRGKNVLLEHAGKTYTAHNKETGCVFLNLSNGRCRIHEQFGAAAKPLGCRVFPFQISSTFAGEASVVGRFDCPTVRQNLGELHTNQLGELREYAAKMDFAGGFDDVMQCHLDREQIEAVVEFLSMMLPGLAGDAQRAIFIALFCDWLSTMQTDELDREVLGKMFLPLKEQIDAAMNLPEARPNAMHRLAFRTLLGLYMRRDEDVLNHRAGRIGRAIALTNVVLGYGDFHRLGLSHRQGKLRRVKLFRSAMQPHDPATFALFWRMIRTKLQSFQFMGDGNNGRNFLDGLKSLALLYPLTLAVAKYSAANREASDIEADDVDWAVAAIEHSFGRLAVLNQPFTRSLEKLLLEPHAFARLVRSV